MNDHAGKILLVLTNSPDRENAVKMSHALVEKRLAACVNVLEGCTSVYRWKGEVQTEHEVTLLIKTRAELYSSLEQAILELNPYELPEIIAVSPCGGFAPYLSWVASEVVANG